MSACSLGALLSRKRLLIFDFDGTLADSSPLHDRAFNEAFAPFGIAVDYQRIAGLTTGTAVDMLTAEAGLDLDDEARTALIRDKQARARGLIAQELVALDGAVEFVRRAQPHFALALCTSASRPTLEAAMARIGLDGCFDPVITAEDVSRGKPDPEGLELAVRHHQVGAGEALVFEDADSGLAAARAAGIDAVRIVTGPTVDSHCAGWAALNVALEEVLA